VGRVLVLGFLLGCGRIDFATLASGDGGGMTSGVDVGDAPIGCGLHLGPARLHTCASTPDHMAVCWGDGAYGQLGEVARADRSTPTAQPFTDVVDIDGGRYETCVARTNGEAW
jgi:hypothetical protein